MSGKAPPKSILKKSSQKTTSATTTTDRTRALALHHAQLIQDQRDAETQILDATLQLIDLPLDSIDPARPTASESLLLKRIVKSFQPKDYDDLVRERNIYDKCGYVLCHRKRYSEKTGARSKIIRGRQAGGSEVKIVSTEELEKWCSSDCAERALYVRVQLSNEPAWLRAGSPDEITLLDEARSSKHVSESLVDEMKSPTAEEKGDVTENIQNLAIERGDTALGHSRKRVDVASLVERATSRTTPQPPSKEESDEGLVEGYKPRKELLKRTLRKEISDEDEDDDILDTI